MTLRLSVLLVALLVGPAAGPARAIDPPVGQGYLRYGDQRYELRHVQAVQSRDDPRRVWILLTTTAVSVTDAADPSRTLALATSGTLRGVRLSVDSAAPRAGELAGALLLGRDESPGGELVFAAGAERYWERLLVGDKRIVGKLRYAVDASSSGGARAWALDASFSAPIFNPR